MKPAQIFHQYIWIINTLRAYKRLTFEELNQKCIDFSTEIIKDRARRMVEKIENNRKNISSQM